MDDVATKGKQVSRSHPGAQVLSGVKPTNAEKSNKKNSRSEKLNVNSGGGLEIFQNDDELVMVTLPEVSAKLLAAAIQRLTTELRASQGKRKALGVIVLPKDRVYKSTKLNERIRELSRRRITLRNSPDENIDLGAAFIRNEILRHRDYAEKHFATFLATAGSTFGSTRHPPS